MDRRRLARIGRLTRGQAEPANSSGNIEIGISEGPAAWVDAKSTKGSVRNSLAVQQIKEVLTLRGQ